MTGKEPLNTSRPITDEGLPSPCQGQATGDNLRLWF